MGNLRRVLDLGNHGKVCAALKDLDAGADLGFVKAAVAAQTRAWLALSKRHLQTAKAIRVQLQRDWRCTVSRAYYAAYTAARAIRYFVHGQFDSSAADHKKASELPDDFPDRDQWREFLVILRDDRNKADYHPWRETYWELSESPDKLLDRSARFVGLACQYLRERGVQP